jgi:tripartite-type tricarboxylate transporter receptor subunit TctC
MTMHRMRPLRRALLACLACLAISGPAVAQQARPTRVVVPYGAGGISDAIGRTVAEALAEELGRPFVVENRSGAGGALGVDQVARAAPDGHTVLVTEISALSVTPALTRVNYDPLRDLQPVAMVAFGPLLLAVHPEVPVARLADIAAQGGRLNLSSAGNGSMGHLAAEELKGRLGTSWQHIPYRSGSEAINAVLGRHADGFLLAAFAAVPHVTAGTLRPIAVAAERRIASLPQVPTFAEIGMPDFVRGSWQAVFVPARTPPEVVRELAERLQAILAREALSRRLGASGADVAHMGPDALGAFLREDIARWGALIRASGIQAN